MWFDIAINPRVYRDWRHCLAFGLGAGLARKAPGTWGTLAAMPLCVTGWYCLPWWAYGVLLSVMFALGVWCCEQVSRELGVQDHGGIVWDEWVGYGVVLLGVPASIWVPVVAFVLFRLFDIVKPWPVSWCDRHVHGGLGVMLDDLVAGGMAWVVLQCLTRFGVL